MASRQVDLLVNPPPAPGLTFFSSPRKKWIMESLEPFVHPRLLISKQPTTKRQE